MIRLIVLTTIGFFACVGVGLADAKVPTKDIDGASDSELVGRLSGAVIVDYLYRDFDEARYPLTELKQVKGEKNLHQPEQSKQLEGERTRIIYFNPPGSSTLKVIRGYQKELEKQGAKELFGCKGSECGGKENSAQNSKTTTIANYIWPKDSVKHRQWSIGWCAQMRGISEQRYSLLHVPGKNAYVSLHAYTLRSLPYPDDCNKYKGVTVSVIDILKLKELEAEFVTVKADEMASEITSSGKIALYGILFDSGQATLKAESKATLDEIGALLKADDALRLLIVGHTDTEGAYDFNLDLSQRRAEAVVASLVADYGIGRERLFPVGVSFASPVATNLTEEGRAKNRRVELVQF
jgi:outer membrane protein OmpA-like peptidoglycan-associated protein